MRKFWLLLLCLAFLYRINAQPTAEDSILLHTSIEEVISLHNKVLKENIHLYNGPENISYNHSVTGTPYFMADSLQVGTVMYDDTYYKNVSMLYDLVQDNVVIQQYSFDTTNASEGYRQMLRQDLVKSKVDWFILPGHEFVRLPADSSSTGMLSGFYERKYNGRVKFFVKRFKRYIEEVRGQDLERRYDLYTQYYIFQNGKYYQVRSQKSLPAIFRDKKKEVNAFVRKNRKKYKKNKEQLFFETTRYYDHLIL